MKKTGLLRIVGSIDEDAYRSFSEGLAEFESQGIKEVNIELNSGGGDAYEALAISARMRLSPCKLTVTVFGQASSAAVLILASGDIRRMTKESWVMVHEDSGKHTGTVVELEREAKRSRQMETQWAEILAMHTATNSVFWTKLHKETTYLTPAGCLGLDLIDEVV